MKGQGKDKKGQERTRKDKERTSVRNILVFFSFLDPNPKNTFHNGLSRKDEKMTRKDEKRTRIDKKRTRKDEKRTKGLFLLICSKKDRKDNTRQKTSRVPPWVFIPVRNILVFFYFYKVNQ